MVSRQGKWLAEEKIRLRVPGSTGGKFDLCDIIDGLYLIVNIF